MTQIRTQNMIAALFLLLLAGCSTVPDLPGTAIPLNAKARQQQLQAMTQFNLRASIYIKAPSDSVSGSLRWQQQDAKQYHARMSTSIGISIFDLKQLPNYTELTVNGEHYMANDIDTLLQQLAGWSIPLSDMPLWLRGLPGERGTDIVYDEFGRVTAFSLTDSAGVIWQLQYQGFFADALALPKRLLLTSSDTQIKLLIRSWQ